MNIFSRLKQRALRPRQSPVLLLLFIILLLLFAIFVAIVFYRSGSINSADATFFSTLRFVMGAALTWLIVVYLNETYKELLRHVKLPETTVRSLMYSLNLWLRLTRYSYTEITADAAPNTAPRPPTDSIKMSRRIIRWVTFPLQLLISGFFTLAAIAFYDDPANQHSDINGAIVLGIISVFWFVVTLLSLFVFETTAHLQIKSNNYLRNGRLKNTAEGFLLWPYALFILSIQFVIGLTVLAVVASIFFGIVYIIFRLIYDYITR